MVEKISRSEQKRLFKQVEELAQQLVNLSDNDLKVFPSDAEIKKLIVECRNLKGGALKRQTKYLAKILRQESLDEIYAFMKERKGSDLKKKQAFHVAERWRDVLINEGMELYNESLRDQVAFEPNYKSHLVGDVVKEYQSLTELEVRRTVYQYVRTRSKVHYRELFRMIKAASDLEERSS